MLTGNNFVYFGPEKWDGLWRNRHHLLTRFSKKNIVLYVEPRHYLKKIREQLKKGNLSWKDFFNNFKEKRITHAGANLYIYHSPLYTPISGRFPLNFITFIIWKIFLVYSMRRLKIFKPIVWLSRPDMADLINKFHESLLIYHVVDEYLAYSGITNAQRLTLEKKENLLLKKSDLVIVVSKNLLKSKQKLNNNTFLVPNAVDYPLYKKAINSNFGSPSNIRDIQKPIIGYSGLISAKLDLRIIFYLSKIHPEWSIVLLGEIDYRFCSEYICQLKKMENVHFLKRKPISQVPYYVNAFDICIAPYIVNEHSQNISPLKIYDYMALGKPIVCTNFEAALKFKNVIYIGKSKQEFDECIKKGLSEINDSISLKRKRIALQNSWEDRVGKISKLILLHLQNRNIEELF